MKIYAQQPDTNKKHNFKKKLIAGICPDCHHLIMYRKEFDLFECSNSKCLFIADENGFMIYNNAIDKAVKSNKTQNSNTNVKNLSETLKLN